MADARWLPGRRRVAAATICGSYYVTLRLASRSGAIVAGGATTRDLGVINFGSWLPCAGGMTAFARTAGQNMRGCFPGCGSAVVTS